MNGNQNRSCRNPHRVGHSGFSSGNSPGKIAKAIENLKEHGIESVGWIGFFGFGIATVARMIGV